MFPSQRPTETAWVFILPYLYIVSPLYCQPFILSALRVICRDIDSLIVDAIVNAANASLLLVGEVYEVPFIVSLDRNWYRNVTC